MLSAPWTSHKQTTIEAGTSPGEDITPGSNDGGWIVPPPARLSDGSTVQLYKDGEALHAAYRMIQAAQRTIDLEIYIFHADETGRAFAELLAQRARDGLQVRVSYDSIGSIDSDREVFQMMRRAGVRLHEFHPWLPWRWAHSWRPFNRDHRKLLVVDHRSGILGGQNLGNEYGSSWLTRESRAESWRDTAIGVVGPSVKLLVAAFERMWRYIEHGGPLEHAEFIQSRKSHAEDPRGSLIANEPARQRIEQQSRTTTKSALDVREDSLAVLASVPSPRSRLRPELRRLLRDAQTSVEMTMAYFAPPQDLFKQLCRSARNGVRVRLMLPSRSDVPLLVVAARAFYQKLMDAGVEIYERQGAVLHAKTVCVDRRLAIVGSTNLDYRSIQYNFELSAVISSRIFGAQMHELFEHDVCFARRIEPDEWRQLPLRDRLVQWAVFCSRYLL